MIINESKPQETELRSGQVSLMSNNPEDWFQIALPQKGSPSFRLTAGDFQTIVCEEMNDGMIIHYRNAQKAGRNFDMEAAVHIAPTNGGGIRVRMTLDNRESCTVPQIQFPCLRRVAEGLDHNKTRFVLARNSFDLFKELSVPAGDTTFYDLKLKKFMTYPFSFDFSMKWFDINDGDNGISVYSEDASADIQGVHLERPARDSLHVNAEWCHFPYSEPGRKWESPAFVVTPHRDGWLEGIKPYKTFANQQFPELETSKLLTSGIGYLTLWMREPFDDSKIYKMYRDIPAAAKEAKRCGLNELVLWFTIDKNFGLPLAFSDMHGSLEEWKEAVRETREIGVNVSVFISCNLIPPHIGDKEWYVLNPSGCSRGDNWTYDWDFTPSFQPMIDSSGYAIYSCPASKSWRAGYEQTVRNFREAGIHSICYDQLFVVDPCFNPEHDHKPGETHNLLYDIMRSYKEEDRAADPHATFSSEFISDVSSSFQDYTWEWHTSEPHPFKYVFPRNYCNIMIDRDTGRAVQGVIEGYMLNVYPDFGRGLLGDHPEVMSFLQKLHSFKGHWDRFFNSGEYKYNEGLDLLAAPHGRVWTYEEETVVFLFNSQSEVLTVRLIPSLQRLLPGKADGEWRIEIYDLDNVLQHSFIYSAADTAELKLDGQELRAIRIYPV
ncbi:DUF6259 domain-containing protein [Paenibacillus nasutitermitis]|uniref:DUF6259 domain-containing protein n=1 Tax=Paenibacillus nasutitermitis TaxID=1652958 RepID=A0A916ZDC4_9BACL|nr:DUF6259 domain-containing protein [Paenibacillus nasutitermitis]GGD89664.1 hypothetical protein GCM10010911_55350 [Paenibacillus nasutitermitis]